MIDRPPDVPSELRPKRGSGSRTITAAIVCLAQLVLALAPGAAQAAASFFLVGTAATSAVLTALPRRGAGEIVAHPRRSRSTTSRHGWLQLDRVGGTAANLRQVRRSRRASYVAVEVCARCPFRRARSRPRLHSRRRANGCRVRLCAADVAASASRDGAQTPPPLRAPPWALRGNRTTGPVVALA